MKFLIIDDDADSTFLASRNLLAAFPECFVDNVKGGNEALEAMRIRGYDAVVTDYRMPWMDGLEFTRKAREARHFMPIVIRTAMDDLYASARSAGANYVLPWYRWRELGEIVKDLLQQQRDREDADLKMDNGRLEGKC